MADVEPIWVEAEDVIAICRDELELTGEPYILRDGLGLMSATDRPKNAWVFDGEDDVLVLAVKLFLGIARTHPFLQGNKRSAYTAMLMFLELNGYYLALADSVLQGRIMEDAVIGDITEAEFITLLDPLIRPLDFEE